MAAIGSGVIASVFDEIAHLRYSGADAGICVRVVQRVGSAQDAPVLIDRLESIVREYPYANEFRKEGGRATEEAIHQCLEKLTGRTNPETSPEGRVTFWLKWWHENAGKVVRGTLCRAERALRPEPTMHCFPQAAVVRKVRLFHLEKK